MSDDPAPSTDAAERRDQLVALDAKLDQVLALLRGPVGTPDPGTPDPGTSDPDTFWALAGLRRRLVDPDGGVLFTGSTRLPTGEEHAWQQAATTASLLDLDWADAASCLAALAHPVRLQLLQLVATGVRTTAELAEAEGLGTSGQLHHHVRQLVTAGWLRKAGRGRYEIPAPRLVPLLVVLAATQH